LSLNHLNKKSIISKQAYLRAVVITFGTVAIHGAHRQTKVSFELTVKF